MTIKPLLFLLSVTIVRSESVLFRRGQHQARHFYKRQADGGKETSQQAQELVGLKSFFKQLESVSIKLFLKYF